jgi:DNA-binding beta-propeller fold protein YncE/TolB-like protein
LKRCVFSFGLLTLCMLAQGLFSPASAISNEPERMRIAIADFETMGGDIGFKDVGSIVAEWLITSFVQSGRFEVVERSQLQKILEEQKLALSGLVAQETAVKLGKVLGVKVIISGTLIKMKETIEINSRLIDTQDGSIIKAEKRKAERIADLESTVEELATQIKGDFPLVGYIVNVSPSEVMIDLGWKHGASVRQAFVVFREGKQIIHPTTNQVLAVEEIQVGEIRLVDVDRITSTGLIVRQCEGKNVQIGDRVRTPTPTPAPTLISSRPSEIKVESASPASPFPPPVAPPEKRKQEGKSQQHPQFLLRWGEEGRAPGKFAAPQSICIDKKDRMFVADSENHRIQVFDLQGQLLRTIGKKGRGEGEFVIPTGVAADEEGYLYVVDSGNRRVQKFDPNGSYLLQWGNSGKRGEGTQFSAPSGITISKDGAIWVSDAKTGRIQCFDRQGKLLLAFGNRGRGLGELSRPTKMATDKTGNLYVSDAGNCRILKFDGRGNYLTSFERKGRRDSDFVLPAGIAVSPSGYLFVADRDMGRVAILDGNGTRLFAFGERGRTDGKLGDPTDVALDREGNIYVLERGGARVQKFSPFAL